MAVLMKPEMRARAGGRRVSRYVLFLRLPSREVTSIDCLLFIMPTVRQCSTWREKVYTTNCRDILTMPNMLNRQKMRCGNHVEKVWKIRPGKPAGQQAKVLLSAGCRSD